MNNIEKKNKNRHWEKFVNKAQVAIDIKNTEDLLELQANIWKAKRNIAVITLLLCLGTILGYYGLFLIFVGTSEIPTPWFIYTAILISVVCPGGIIYAFREVDRCTPTAADRLKAIGVSPSLSLPINRSQRSTAKAILTERFGTSRRYNGSALLYGPTRCLVTIESLMNPLMLSTAQVRIAHMRWVEIVKGTCKFDEHTQELFMITHFGESLVLCMNKSDVGSAQRRYQEHIQSCVMLEVHTEHDSLHVGISVANGYRYTLMMQVFSILDVPSRLVERAPNDIAYGKVRMYKEPLTKQPQDHRTK